MVQQIAGEASEAEDAVWKCIKCNAEMPHKKVNRQNTSLAAPGALAHRLQRHTACKIQNGRQGARKWPTAGMPHARAKNMTIKSGI